MRRLIVLAVVLLAALLSSPAFAGSPVPIQWVDNVGNLITVKQGLPGGLPTTEQDKDRDFSTWINLFTGVTLTTGGATGYIFQMSQPKYIGQFTRASIHLTYTYAAQSDSDSTFVGVRVYGLTSLNGGTRYLWTPQRNVTGANDTCFCKQGATTGVDSTSAIGQCFNPQVSFVLVRSQNGGFTNALNQLKVNQGYLGGGALIGGIVTRGTLRKIPPWAIVYAGTNGAVLNLTDTSGAPFPFAWILVEVFNLNWSRNLTNVQADLWPRVF